MTSPRFLIIAILALFLAILLTLPTLLLAAKPPLPARPPATSTARFFLRAGECDASCLIHLPLLIRTIDDTPNQTPTPTVTPTTASPATTTATPSPTVTTLPSTCVAIPSGAITYVALGDSLTAGDGDEAEADGFVGRTFARIEQARPGSVYTNLGRSGWTSGDLINGVNGEQGELPQAVTILNQAKNEGRPAIATIWIGSNDLWYLYEYADPTAENEAQDVTNYSNNLATILGQLQATGASLFIALLDDQSKRPIAIAGEALPGTSQAELALMAQQVIRYNNTIRSRASQYGAVTVDFYNTTIFTNSATLAEDGNHPNAAGYEQITGLWFAAMKPRLEGCQKRGNK